MLHERTEELAAHHIRPGKVTSLNELRQPRQLGQPAAALIGTRASSRAPKDLKNAPRAALAPLAREFKGCYHCGKPGHARAPNNKLNLDGRKAFAALKNNNDGAIPQDYEGAPERVIKEQNAAHGASSITSLQQADQASAPQPQIEDYTESVFSHDGIEAGDATKPEGSTQNCTAVAPVDQSASACFRSAPDHEAMPAWPLPAQAARPPRHRGARLLLYTLQQSCNGRANHRCNDHEVASDSKAACGSEDASAKAKAVANSKRSDGNAAADDKCPLKALKLRAHVARPASSSKQGKLKRVEGRFRPQTSVVMMQLQQMLTANVNYKVSPPMSKCGPKCGMIDSGLQPSVANCRRDFPDNPIKVSEGQKAGLIEKRGRTAPSSPVRGRSAVCITNQMVVSIP